MKKLNDNKIFKTTKRIIQALMIIFLICFVFAVCLQRFSENKLSFFNYRMFTVISGSMKPRYNIGDVLISKDVDSSKIKVGDTISYLGGKGDFKNKVITHEVVGIDKDENGEVIFRAKGLTNIVEDPIIYERQLFGKVVYKSIILSIIYKIIGTKLGFYILIIIPLLFIIGYEIVQTLIEKEEEKRRK